MKRIFALILVIIFCLGTASCGAEEKKETEETATDGAETEITQEEESTLPKETVLSLEELKNAVTVIPLTTENWREYFTLHEYEEITPADFPDEEPEIEKDLYVKLKSENACAADVVARFSYTQTLTQNQYDAATKVLNNSSKGGDNNDEDTLERENVSPGGSIGTLGSTGTCTYRKYEHNGTIYESILDVRNVQCTKIVGTIFLFDLPESAWNTLFF